MLIEYVSPGEKMEIHMNISFPMVPCELLTLDVMDVSGDVQSGVMHGVNKVRLAAVSEGGYEIETRSMELYVSSGVGSLAMASDGAALVTRITTQPIWILLTAATATALPHQPTQSRQAAVTLVRKFAKHMPPFHGPLAVVRTSNSASASTMRNTSTNSDAKDAELREASVSTRSWATSTSRRARASVTATCMFTTSKTISKAPSRTHSRTRCIICALARSLPTT